MKITSLAYALLGLLNAAESSGYALRRMFETTPLGAFSSSPGSIYPALNKLVKLKMIEKARARPSDKSLFRITDLGREALTDWLSLEVNLDEVEKSPTLVILRFSFLESLNEPSLTVSFLQSFRQVLDDHLLNLNSFMESAEGCSLSVYGRLSMESGISQYQAYSKWVDQAINTFKTNL